MEEPDLDVDERAQERAQEIVDTLAELEESQRAEHIGKAIRAAYMLGYNDGYAEREIEDET